MFLSGGPGVPDWGDVFTSGGYYGRAFFIGIHSVFRFDVFLFSISVEV